MRGQESPYRARGLPVLVDDVDLENDGVAVTPATLSAKGRKLSDETSARFPGPGPRGRAPRTEPSGSTGTSSGRPDP
ncbi:hypothetical protein ACFPN0_30025 [Kitasatospora cinereorecta]